MPEALSLEVLSHYPIRALDSFLFLLIFVLVTLKWTTYSIVWAFTQQDAAHGVRESNAEYLKRLGDGP